MLESSGYADGAGAAVDSGAGGFLSIFGSNADAQDTTTYSDAQDQATDAETSSPEDATSESYTSADDVVATRLAASLEADGYEIATDDEGETEEGEEGYDLSNYTPEQLHALANEALEAQRTNAESQEAQVQEYVRNKVLEAERAAVNAIDARFQAEVLSRSAAHYDNELNKRVAAIVQASRTVDNPAAFIVARVADATRTVNKARQDWEATQSQDWNKAAYDAAQAVRGRVPELRQYYAIQLARRFNLPQDAVKDIAHPRRDIEHFEARAEEIAGIVQFAQAERQRSANGKRQVANQALREAPIRTSSTGKPVGGKVPAYKGTPDEFLKLHALGLGSDT